MHSRFSVWLDDIALDSIDPSIYIFDIRNPKPQFSNSSYSLPRQNGQIVNYRKITAHSVTVAFLINEYDVSQRNAVCREITKWALHGKKLKTNERPDQYMQVSYVDVSAVETAIDFTQELTITFYSNIPYWLDDVPLTKTLSLSGGSTSADVLVPGTADYALVDVSITATSGRLTSFGVSAGDSTIRVSYTGSNTYTNFVYTHNDDGTELITPSALASAISEMTSYLRLKCGEEANLIFYCNTAANAVFTIRGTSW